MERRETPALPLNQDRRARGLAPGEEANTSAAAAAAAAFLFCEGSKRERLEATADGTREGRLTALGLRVGVS